jgi:hypothetical protein
VKQNFKGDLTMSKIKFFTILSILLLTLFPCLNEGGWYETEDMSTSNFNNSGGAFHEIPGSSYVIWSGLNNSMFNQLNKTMVIFDASTGRCKGTYKTELQPIWAPEILPDANSGWNIYFSASPEKDVSKYGKLHIKEDGLFGEFSWLDTDFSGAMYSIVILTRNEVWFAADKIYRLKNPGEEWTTFDYPEGWDSDFSFEASNPFFISDDEKKLFIKTYANTNGYYQGVFVDLETSNTGSLIKLDSDDFFQLRGVTNWIGHDNKYLLLNQKSLWLYDSVSGTLELFIDGFTTSSYKIIQSEDGKNIYTYENNAIDKLDLENKSIERHQLTFEDFWGFYPEYFSLSLPYYNKADNTLLHVICLNPKQYPEQAKPVIINLNDFSLTYFPGVMYKDVGNFTYVHNCGRLVAVGTDYKYIMIGDINTGGTSNTIPLSFQADSWSIMNGADCPSIVGNGTGRESIRILPLGRRDLLATESKVYNVSQYMDGTRAFTQEAAGYREYLYADRSSEDIQLQNSFNTLYPDPSRDMLISTGGSAVQFIESHGQVNVWLNEVGNDVIKASIYDSDNKLVWTIFQNKDTSEWHFYKISTETYAELDSFTMPAETLRSILDFKSDPLQRYLYFINDLLKDSNTRELVIFDIANRQAVKRIAVQTDVQMMDVYTHVFPGIVPVPSKERLVLWDHYGSWCVNTENLELIYGTAVKPGSLFYTEDAPIKGCWDEEREKVVFVDLGFHFMNPADKGIVVRINVDTGEVIDRTDIPDYQNIRKVFFPKDKSKVFLLAPNSSKVYTIYLEPAWENPATIDPSTNYLQLGAGDNAKFIVNVKNPYDVEQKVTAYIWMFASGIDFPFFFDGIGISTKVKGMPLTIPAKFKILGDIMSFTMPAGLPQGYYNLNAIFINEQGNPGPMGTWNFYVKD